MIPKTIHYCWFGRGEKPDSFQKCLESWKKYCPDYTIKEWNEETALPYRKRFAEDALRKRKYAFAADAVRVEVLASEGGIYLDTDMLLVKPLDELLNFNFFTGYEVPGRPAYGLFGAVKDHPLILRMKLFYRENRFNEFSPPVITHTFKKLIIAENLGEKDRILESEYFYPLTYQNREKDYRDFVTENTVAVHLWDHSWSSPKKDGFWQLVRKFNTVCIDRIFYGYPKSYFRRYAKEFARKIYHKLINKKVV
jgi:mannosyltransferase OCH1-like enzyme